MIRLFVLVLFALPLLAERGIADDLDSIRDSLTSGDQPVKIVCFGDSVTGVYYHTGGKRAYTDMLGIALQQICPDADVEMVNAGLSGHTTANALARISRDVSSKKPDLVTVMFGLNDVAKLPIDAYRKNLLAIVDHCRAAGSAVILCTPNAVITTENRPIETLEKYCDVVRAVAAEKGVPLCDLYGHFLTLQEADYDTWKATLSDEIHPNMAGHKIMAEQIAKTITESHASLTDIPPPALSLEKTLSLLREGKPVRIIAMPPFDELIADSLRSVFPDAELNIETWPTKGLSLYQLRKDASHRIRKQKPDLVLVATPRDAAAKDREEFFHEQTWIVNYALSFGKQEWDVVVIHPSVAAPAAALSDRDHWIRSITRAQDLNLVDRARQDTRSAGEIFSEWISSQLTAEETVQ